MACVSPWASIWLSFAHKTQQVSFALPPLLIGIVVLPSAVPKVFTPLLYIICRLRTCEWCLSLTIENLLRESKENNFSVIQGLWSCNSLNINQVLQVLKVFFFIIRSNGDMMLRWTVTVSVGARVRGCREQCHWWVVPIYEYMASNNSKKNAILYGDWWDRNV